MKSFILLMAGLLSFSLVAKEFTVENSYNGTRIQCEILGDIGKRAFKLEVKDSYELSDEYVVNLGVKFFTCDKVDGKYTLVETALNEVTYRNVLTSTLELGRAKYETVFTHFNVVDAHDRLIKKVVLNLSENPQDVEIRFAKDHKFIFFTAHIKSRVETPEGVVIPDIFEFLGGLVLKEKK